MAFAIQASDLDTTDGMANWIAYCQSIEVCSPSLSYFEQCQSASWTLRQTIYNVPDQQPDVYIEWLTWGRETISGDLDPVVRQCLSDVATANDSRLAAQWDIQLTDASQDEHAMLRARWYSGSNGGMVIYPTIEDQVASGAITLVALGD